MPDYTWLTWTGWAVGSLGGAALVAWLIGRSARGWRHCSKCTYDMTGTPGLRCPECGKTAKSERGLVRRQRSRLMLRLSIVLLLGGVVLRSVEPYRRDGWAGPVPMAVLSRIAPLFDEDGRRLLQSNVGSNWLLFGAIDPQLRAAFFASAAGTPPPPPTRWERVLLARQVMLAAERFSNAGESGPATSDIDLVRRIPSLLTDQERVILTGAFGALVISSDEEFQRLGLEHLQRYAARTNYRIDEIARVARTSPAATLRRLAYETVSTVGTEGSVVVAVLRAGLDDQASFVRADCARCLRDWAKHARPALDQLNRLAKDDWDQQVRSAAEQAADAILTVR